jgi:hypothetical protein
MDLLSRINFAIEKHPEMALVLCCTIGLLVAGVIMAIDQPSGSGLIFSGPPPRG